MDKTILCIILTLLVISPFVSAGVGIKWDQESVVVNEGEKTCLTYEVYNPWPEESYVKIELSGEIEGILTNQESEEKLVPANTASGEAIPIKFCFKAPELYEKDCLLGSLVCKRECNEEQRIYSGEVVVKSIPIPAQIGGSGGSATTMAVSAPLNIKIRCNSHSRNFTLVYVFFALVFGVFTAVLLYSRYKKPELERDREKLEKLQGKIKKESNNKRNK